MKRKFILTITIAALLCILFAFTVSATNYIDISNMEFSPYSYNMQFTNYSDAISNVEELFGVFAVDSGSYEVPMREVGFINIDWWHSQLSTLNVTDSISFVEALDYLASIGAFTMDCTLYAFSCSHSLYLYRTYQKYLSEINQPTYEQGFIAGEIKGYNDGYDEGFSAGETKGYSDGYVKGANDGQALGYENGYEEGYYWGDYDGSISAYEAAGDYIKEWFTLQKLNNYIESDSLDAKEKFEYEFSHNSVALKEAAYSKGETDGLNASGIAKEGILSIISAPFYFLSGVFNFEIFGVNLFSIISVILTLAVVGYFFKKIKG